MQSEQESSRESLLSCTLTATINSDAGIVALGVACSDQNVYFRPDLSRTHNNPMKLRYFNDYPTKQFSCICARL